LITTRGLWWTSLKQFPTAPTGAPQIRGVTMADKSPKKSNTKKPGKSLKEKRNEKHAKKESKKGFAG
jgi:hypothetical protein